jgi:hypothetical protein
MPTADQTDFTPIGVAPDKQLPLLWLPLRLALWLVAGAVLACWLALVVLHINDDYRVIHTQGVWVAVAEAARAGHLYPPIFDGEHYAGTRYMPLPILLNALTSTIVGDPLIAGKLLAAILMATLLALVVFVLRGFSCPWPLAAALAVVVVATETGLQAATTIGGDLLPAVLQVGALAVTLHGRGRRVILIAGGLAGLAVASKLTGVWAFLGVTTWLVMQAQWRRAAIFAVACVGTAAMILGAVQLLTDGGLTEHLLAFSVAGVHSAASLLRGPNQILYNLLGHASGAVVLLPLAVLGALLSSGWRQLSVIHLSLGYALLLLLVVYTDVGTGFNQLLDLVVLTTLAVGHLAGRAATSTDRAMGSVVALAVVVTVFWAAGLDLVRTVGFDLRRTRAAMTAGETNARAATVVASVVRPEEEVLAEDPSIYVALGRRPLVMDPFMVMRLERVQPQRVDPLISWIADRRFDLIVLVVPLEDRTLDYWWTDYHFGPRVVNALRDSYAPDRRIGRYHLYRPRPLPVNAR